MQRLRMALVAGASLVAAVSAAGAQMRVAGPVPAAMVPPAGLCRVWLDGVAPARQPAPTDCATARVQAPVGSRLVHGPQASSLRTTQGRGGFDPRRDRRADDRDRRDGGGWWERSGRDRGEWDRMSDKERRKAQRKHEKEQRKHEKEHRKRDKEWEKSQRARGHDDGHDDDDDDDRGDRRRGESRRDGRTDSGAGRVSWPGRVGVPTSRPCIDANRDGVCDWRP